MDELREVEPNYMMDGPQSRLLQQSQWSEYEQRYVWRTVHVIEGAWLPIDKRPAHLNTTSKVSAGSIDQDPEAITRKHPSWE